MYQVIILTGALSGPPTQRPNIPSTGAYKCANALRINGFSCLVIGHILDYSLDEINELLDHAVSEDTLMIGVSTTFLTGTPEMTGELANNDTREEQLDSFVNNKSIMDKYQAVGDGFDATVLHRLRQKFPKIKFVTGGYNANPDREVTGLDFICLGYSEISIVDIANHLLHGTAIPKSRRNIFGTVIVDDATAELHDFHNETMTWLPEDVVTHTKLPIEISRGCIFNCKFCAFPMRGKNKLDYIKSADCLRAELMYNYENYGITEYSIVDDTFNDSREKLSAVRDMVSTLPFQPTFWCFARLDLIAIWPDTLDTLYQIGIRSMFLGIETLNRKSGLAIGKGFEKDKLISIVKTIKQRYPDIVLYGSFIMGVPYESVESVQETNRLLCSGEFPLDSWKFRPLQIWRPTTVTRTVWLSEFDMNWEKYGYTEIENPPDQVKVYWKNEEMDYFTAVELCTEFETQYREVIKNKIGKTWFNPYIAAWLEKGTRRDFLPGYKQRLLEIVKSKKSLT